MDKFTGQPKGCVITRAFASIKCGFSLVCTSFAYVEFESEACVAKALALEGSMLHQRPLKVRAALHTRLHDGSHRGQVVPKRTNVPRFQLPGRRPSPRSRYPMYRPRRRPHYNPYGYQ